MQHGFPHFLSEGHALLFTVLDIARPALGHIAFLSPGSGERKLLTEGNSPQYTSSGHLLFHRDGALWAAGFDSQRGAFTSEAVPVVEGVESTSNIAKYSVSQDGTLVYLTGGSSGLMELVWVNREGQEQPLGAELGFYVNPRISPDGDRVAVSVQSPEAMDLWIYPIERDILTRLTFDSSPKYMPLWSPDGAQVVYF